MSRRKAFLVGALGLMLGAFVLGLALTQGMRAEAQDPTAPDRLVTYELGAPENFPILAQISLNGASLVPTDTTTVQGSSPSSYSDGRAVAGTVQRRMDAPNALEIKASWIEWSTGNAYAATLDLPWPDQRGSLTLYFDRDGALTAYTQSPELLEGTLGRAANKDGYLLLAEVCATPLPADSSVRADLGAKRSMDLGVLVDEVEAAGRPIPPANACSE